MTLPIDLVLVRHGQSEGNKAKHLSSTGDHSVFTETFRDRHAASFRLTDLGRQQALEAGNFLRNDFFTCGAFGFQRYLTSQYARAMETAGLLALPDAQWLCDFYLTERDWGELDVCPENEREELYGNALRRLEIEPFFLRPPNGESFAQHCFRVDRVLQTLHRKYSNMRVIIVCHGEVMRAFQVRIEHMSQERFKKLSSSADPLDRIYNCQIVHYSRRSPNDGRISQYIEWVRWIRPTEKPVTTSGWQQIHFPRYSNESLLSLVEQIPRMVN